MRSGSGRSAAIVQQRNVVVIGPCGSGKTQAINSLTGVKLFKRRPESAGDKPACRFASATFTLDGEEETAVITWFDTDNMIDSAESFEKMKPEWNRLVMESLTEIHFVMFVIPFDANAEMLQQMNVMWIHLVEWGMTQSQVLLLINKSDLDSHRAMALKDILSSDSNNLSADLRTANKVCTSFSQQGGLRDVNNSKEMSERSCDDVLTVLLGRLPPPFRARQFLLDENISRADGGLAQQSTGEMICSFPKALEYENNIAATSIRPSEKEGMRESNVLRSSHLQENNRVDVSRIKTPSTEEEGQSWLFSRSFCCCCKYLYRPAKRSVA